MPGGSKTGGGLKTKKSTFYKMKGSPMKRNFGITPLKDLGHGGHPGLTKEEAAKRIHGGKMRKEDLTRRQGTLAIQFLRDPLGRRSGQSGSKSGEIGTKGYMTGTTRKRKTKSK